MKNITRLIAPALKTLSQRRKFAYGFAGILLIIALSATVYAAGLQKPPTLVETGMQETAMEDQKSTLTTVKPVLVSASSSVVLLGTVLSHETANIYPRRDGVVEDIYVDIGDTVKKNQIVALLLPKGVEGQSAAMIAEKQARKSQAESDLTSAGNVAQETIINTQQKIQEKETELMVARREQDALLQRFEEAEANTAQMREQAFSASQNVLQLLESILLGSNTRTGADIQEEDLLRNLGIQDGSNSSRYDASFAFNALHKADQEYRNASVAQQSAVIDRLLFAGLDALNSTAVLLQYTPSKPSANGYDSISYQQLTERLNKIVAAQDSLYKAKEKLEDARNIFQTLAASEPELFRAYRSGNIDGKKSNKVRMLEENIRTAQNVLGLTEANQQQIVERQRNMVEIANAALQSEYATSGHREIRSPFAGTVSKRFVDVGQIVMPSMSAFELTDVPTSLAKKAKAEVQFGLPEYLHTAVDVGDTVAFFLQTDEVRQYSAIVTRKSPQVDMQTHTITVQAKVPDDLKLPHQSSVRIRITDAKRPVYRVPSSSVKREGDANYLWTLNSATDVPEKLQVTVMAEDGEFAELTGNITEDIAVIIDPPDLFLTQEKK